MFYIYLSLSLSFNPYSTCIILQFSNLWFVFQMLRQFYLFIDANKVSKPYNSDSITHFGYPNVIKVTVSLFFFDLLHEQDFCEAPPQFFRRFSSQVPDNVYFFDSAGSVFGIQVLKLMGTGFFTTGLRNIFNHYGLIAGGWLEIMYVGGPVFSIRVMNIMLQEVHNPNVARYLEFN